MGKNYIVAAGLHSSPHFQYDISSASRDQQKRKTEKKKDHKWNSKIKIIRSRGRSLFASRKTPWQSLLTLKICSSRRKYHLGKQNCCFLGMKDFSEKILKHDCLSFEATWQNKTRLSRYCRCSTWMT